MNSIIEKDSLNFKDIEKEISFWVTETRLKVPLAKQAALVYNLLRKVIGIEFFRLPSVSKMNYKNKHPKLWTVEDAYFFLLL